MKGKLGNYSPDRGETRSTTSYIRGEFRHKKKCPPKRGANIRKVNLL